MTDPHIDGDSKVLSAWRVTPAGEVDRAQPRRRELWCVNCGRTFRASRKDARYCGSGCRRRAWRAQ